MIREITGFGEGRGPFIAISDGLGGFADIMTWVGLLPNADRVAIDTHAYFAFGNSPNSDPLNVTANDGKMGGIWPGKACKSWKEGMNDMCVWPASASTFLAKRLTSLSKPNQLRCRCRRRIQQRFQRLWLLHEGRRALYPPKPRLRVLERLAELGAGYQGRAAQLCTG